MIFTDDKKYYKERKTPHSIKKKLEKDISKKKIESFSYEDILKETSLSKKMNPTTHKHVSTDEDSVDPYKSSMKKDENTDPLSVYGEDSPFGPDLKLQSGISRELKKKQTRNITKSSTVTLEQFVTDRFMKRKQEKENKNKKPLRLKSKQKNQPAFKNRREKQTIKRTVSQDNTIDKVLEGIPFDK